MKTIKKPSEGWRVERITTHPGTILREDFLTPMGLSANQLALRTRMPATRVGEILSAAELRPIRRFDLHDILEPRLSSG
jgi:hypothetical protein